MKEYTTGDLHALFREAGFSRIQAIVGPQGRNLRTPTWTVTVVERLLDPLPTRARRGLASIRPLRWMLSGRVVATR